MEKNHKKREGFTKLNNAILMFKVFILWINPFIVQFKVGLTGLSEDMEDFMLEQLDYYKNPPHLNCSHCRFFSSFYKTCVDMWQNGIDLSEKQLNIIYREYEKVKEKRYQEVMRSK